MQSSIDFSVSSVSTSGIKTIWEAKYSADKCLKIAIPTCFGGSGNEVSPEDLYLLSLLNCLIATFKVFAEKSKLGYEKLDGFAKLNLIQESSGVSSFKNIDIKLELFSPDNHVKAKRLFNKVLDLLEKKNAPFDLILNSIALNYKVNSLVLFSNL